MKNKVTYMLYRPPISASIVLKNLSLALESYAEKYANHNDFKEIYTKLTRGLQMENYYITLKICAYPLMKVYM